MRDDLGLDEIADVFAVDLDGHRPVAAEPDPVEIMADEDIGGTRAPSKRLRCEPRDRTRPHGDRGDDVEPALERGVWRDPQPETSCVRVGRAVRDEREGGAAETLDVERGLVPQAVLRQRPHHGPGEGDVSGSSAVRPAPETVDLPHELGVEPDAGIEREPAPVDAAERDPSWATLGYARGGASRVAREPEGPRAGRSYRHRG